MPTTDDTSTNLKGIITTQGLSESIKAMENQGWKIYPRNFMISEYLGALDASRTIETINETWYEAPISSVVVQSANTLELICTIPTGATSESKYIREIYITAYNSKEELFLLGIGQISGDVQYIPSGSTKLRILISIQNVDLTSIYVFKYTQAAELEDHNTDPNAHADIRELIDGGKSVIVDTDVYYTEANQHLYVNTLTTSPVIYLPSVALELGNYVTITDYSYNANNNPVIVNRNGYNIDNEPQNFEIDRNGSTVTFYWYPAESTWIADLSGRFSSPSFDASWSSWKYSDYIQEEIVPEDYSAILLAQLKTL